MSSPGTHPHPGVRRTPPQRVTVHHPPVLATATVAAAVAATSAVAGLFVLGPGTAVCVAAGAVVVTLLAVVMLAFRRATVTARELASVRHSLDSLARTTHEVLWRTDAEGRLVWLNDVARDLLGYRQEDLLGRPVTAFIDRDQLPLWHRQIAAFAGSGTGWRDMPHRLVHRDGHTLLVEASGQPVIDRGIVVGYQGTLRPLTAAKAEAERLADERLRVSSLLSPDAIRIAFQPIVNLSTGEVTGVEALTRFVTEPGVPPDVWFSRAWEVGLGVALEMQSLRAAVAAIPELPPHLYVSVNTAPRTVLAPAFTELLHEVATPLDRLVLEITEHESIDDYGVLRAVLAPARRQGLRLAVDDAGAGYASFRHIVKLRPDHIKLDRDLTAGIDTDPARRALASAVVVFALELEASITAEGVETAEQLDTLRSLSVDAAQGFYLGRPSVDPACWHSWGPRRLWLADPGAGSA